MAGQIEFKTKDLYHQHKRNVLFITVAIFALWVSHPGATIPIPGTGTEVQIRTSVAFSMMTLAVLYNTWLFIVEWLAVRTVNSSAVVRTGKEDIDGIIGDVATGLAGTAQDLQTAVAMRVSYGDPLQQMRDRLHEVADLKEGTDSLIVGLRSINRPDPITFDDFKANYAIFNDAFLRVDAEVKRFVDEQLGDAQRARDGTDKAIAAFSEVKGELTRLSGTISRTQRVNFHFDRLLVAACAVISVIVTACSYLGRVPPF